MKMSRLFPTLLCVLLLTACATPKFTAPTSGPTAKLRIKPGGPVTYTWIHTYEKSNCENPQYFGVIGVPDTLLPEHAPKGMIGSAMKPDPNVVEQIIPAKLTTILFTQHGPNSGNVVRSCLLAVNFTAEPGQEYEMDYSYDATQCFASVNTLRLQSGNIVRSPVPNVKKNMGKCVPYMF